MATEANAERPVDAIVPTEPEPAIKINDDTQDVDSQPPSVNGAAASPYADELENKHISDIVDELVNSAEPSISGGSDTELSRPFKGKDDEKGHTRTSSSVKKPATFKSVSVNKTFLAAKGATGVAPAKVGDKPAASTGLTSAQSSAASSARPRLVAKTGSGLGGSISRSGSGANGRPAAAPDPNAVWNKNRPVPPPEPKKFTDEELKKYGIHMANRLQQDDARGQGNTWADIDDDDEDWAPEEIRWTDGTKSTIPHPDEVRPPVPEPVAPEPAAPMVPKEIKIMEKPRSPAPAPAPVPSPSPAPGPTVTATATASPSIKSGVLASGKGLVLKGAPEKPTLVAKPPAPPTPVKSPWATLPPVEKASPILMDLAAPQNAPRPQPRDPHLPQSDTPPPFKEIAADDFSRASFRDGHQHPNRELYNSQSGRYEPVTDRRGGTRTETYARQQPAAVLQRPSHSDHPEPSAAFQTHRTSGQEGPYGRRRNSSNVSGGSGSFIQRLGRSHDQPLPPEVLSARRESVSGGSDRPASPHNASPLDQRPWPPRVSPVTNFATPYGAAQPEARQGVPQGVPQGPPVGVVQEEDFELQKKIMREKTEMARRRRLEEEAREDAARKERIRLKLAALGPAPEKKSAKKEGTKEESSTSAQPQHQLSPQPTNDTISEDSTTATNRSAAIDNKSKSDALPNGMRSQQPTQVLQPSSGNEVISTSSESKQAKSWQSGVQTQPERLPTWGSTANQTSSRNVWGAPNNNRSLGNGTFGSDLVRVADTFPSQVSQMQAKPGPGPIGPPPTQKSAAASLAPIGPPKSAADAPASDPQMTRSAWARAVQASDDSEFQKRRIQRAEQQREAEARGLAPQDSRPIIKDNWKQTKLADDGQRVEQRDKQTVTHNSAAWRPPADEHAESSQTAPTVQVPPAIGSSGASSTSQQSRPSRFFPARDVRLEETTPAETGRSGSPSPPPPDMHGHPAFDGDAAHPHVALPPPQIVVRLPPKLHAPAEASSAQQTSRWAPQQPFMAQTASTSRLTPQELQFPPPKSASSWQDRFDTLFDRAKPSSPPKGAMFDAPGRKAGDLNAQSPATLSFPSIINKGQNLGLDGSVTSRDMAEECFEEQEMGSLPPVRLPHKVPDAAWNPAPAPKLMPRRFQVNPSSAEEYDSFMRMGFGPSYLVNVRFPQMTETKTVTLPAPAFPRTRSNPRRNNYGRGPSQRQASGVQRGSGKPREPSSSYSSEHPPSPGPSQSGGRGRGGFRGRSSDNWGRHSTPLQT